MTSPLALLGGTPAVTNGGPHFTWPPIDDMTRAKVLAQLDSAVSIPGRSGIVADLEDALQDYFGARHAITTSSGTAALHAAYWAARIRPGDEVIVPAWTFHATASPLFQLGAVPILCETLPDGNIDPARVAELITPRTRAIMVTHLWGRPADMTDLAALAKDRDLDLLEDGSHAHGASYGGQKVGTFGLAGAFSLNGPKPLSGGEGGFVLTDDDDTYYRILTFAHYNKRARNEIPKAIRSRGTRSPGPASSCASTPGRSPRPRPAHPAGRLPRRPRGDRRLPDPRARPDTRAGGHPHAREGEVVLVRVDGQLPARPVRRPAHRRVP